MNVSASPPSRLWALASSQRARALPAGFRFVSWEGLLPKDASAFTDALGTPWQLPMLTPAETEELLTRYHDMITSIGLGNGPRSVWWYTWCSSKDRFNSSILAYMDLLARFVKACHMGPPDNLVFLSSDPYLIDSLAKVTRPHGIAVKMPVPDRLLLLRRRVRKAIGPLALGAIICGKALKKKWFVSGRIPLRREAKLALKRTVLVTWLKTRDLFNPKPPTDTFFGSLPRSMNNDDHSVVLFGDLSDGVPGLRDQRPPHTESMVFTVGDFLTLWGIFAGLMRGLFASARVPRSIKASDPILYRLVQKEIRSNRGDIVYISFFENALRRLLKDYRPTHLIHSCENNPWERACSLAVDAMSQKPAVTGFMHCAVLLSHPKIVITEKEKNVRPRPERIICTGDRARNLMIQFGGHSNNEVEAGCALRHEYLWNTQQRGSLSRPIREILVILEGLPSMARFVKFIYDGLDGADGYRVTLRPHPAYSIQRILSEAGLSSSQFKTTRVSDQEHIAQDFETADLVIYKGSTAALEAGYLGIPLIHVDSAQVPTDDPLFQIDKLKEIVRGPEELSGAIDQFATMSEAKYQTESAELREYIRDYLTMPDENSTRAFLPAQA